MSATSAPGSSNVPGVTARTRTASRKSGFSARQRHHRGVAVVRGRLRLGVCELAEPRHPRHVARRQLRGDLPARRQPVLHHGAVRLAVLRLALQQDHEHGVLLQVIEVERLPVQRLELPGDPHPRPRGRQRRRRHAGHRDRPPHRLRPPGCVRSSARSARSTPSGAGGRSLAIQRDMRGRAVPAQHGRGGGSPGLLLRRQSVGRQVGAGHGRDQLGQPIARQAALLQQHRDRRLVAQRGAVVERPPFPGRRRQGRSERRLGARLVVRQRQRGADLRLGQRRRQRC